MLETLQPLLFVYLGFITNDYLAKTTESHRVEIQNYLLIPSCHLTADFSTAEAIHFLPFSFLPKINCFYKRAISIFAFVLLAIHILDSTVYYYYEAMKLIDFNIDFI